MKIDRNNYEIYFLDYLEGRLTTEDSAALLLFADENPDLKELLEGEELFNLMPDEKISFSPKSALKQKPGIGDVEDISSVSGINAGNYEEFMIRYYENELNDKEKSELSIFLKDSPSSIKEFEILGNTLLKPDTYIVFPHKSRLKRNILFTPGTRKILTAISVAASLLLFSTVFIKYINQPISTDKYVKLAENYHNNIDNGKTIPPKINTPRINPIEISRPTRKVSNTEPNDKEPIIVRQTAFEAPSSLTLQQTSMLASSQVIAPTTIERRTDFDGINSTAYYDQAPEPEPLSSEGVTIGGNLGSTLAQGISQTAGTIGRDPELGRLLRGKISPSDIASLGLSGINLITKSKLSLERKYDADGNIKGYTIVNGNRKMSQLP
jgi:hypothetical protein